MIVPVSPLPSPADENLIDPELKAAYEALKRAARKINQHPPGLSPKWAAERVQLLKDALDQLTLAIFHNTN